MGSLWWFIDDKNAVIWFDLAMSNPLCNCCYLWSIFFVTSIRESLVIVFNEYIKIRNTILDVCQAHKKWKLNYMLNRKTTKWIDATLLLLMHSDDAVILFIECISWISFQSMRDLKLNIKVKLTDDMMRFSISWSFSCYLFVKKCEEMQSRASNFTFMYGNIARLNCIVTCKTTHPNFRRVKWISLKALSSE